MPRKPRRAKKAQAKKVNGKSNGKSNGNGTNGTNHKKSGGAWTPQRRGSPEAWMEKLGYTPAALRCRTLADMTEEEIAAIELAYGAKVLRPIQGRVDQHRNAPRSKPKSKAAEPSYLLPSQDVFSEEVELQDGF